MRITGGRARGVPLKVAQGTSVRPATDGMREALFSSLGGQIEGAHFLDLFAGTGAYGLEALSRGANSGVFVEKNRKSALILQQNLDAVTKSIGFSPGECVIKTADVFKLSFSEPFDLIFADPPYEMADDLFQKLFLLMGSMLKAQGIVCLEASGERSFLGLTSMKLIKRLGKAKQGPSMAIFQR